MKESEQRQIFQEWINKYRALLFKVIKVYAFNTEDQNDLFSGSVLAGISIRSKIQSKVCRFYLALPYRAKYGNQVEHLEKKACRWTSGNRKDTNLLETMMNLKTNA